MPRKKASEDTAKVQEKLSALQSDDNAEPKKKTSTRSKKAASEPVVDDEEITVDGAPAETEEESVIDEPTAEDLAKEVEQDEIVTSEATNQEVDQEADEILEEMDKLQMKLHQIYGTRRSIKRAKRQTIKDMSKDFATTDGYRKDIVVKNEIDYIREETAVLAQAVDNYRKEIKTIHVTGVEPDDDIGWVLTGHLNKENPQYKIKVALSEFIAYTQADTAGLEIKTDHDLINTFRDIASRWIGTDIQVVITKVYQKSLQAYASRLMASEMLAKYYFRRIANGRTKPMFTEGSKVKAQIVEVKRDRVRVSVYGQDAWVKADECFWVFEGPLYDVLHVGEWVNVLILECANDWIYENQEHAYHLAKLTVSIKQARPNPAAKNFKNYEKGGIYEARPLFVRHNNGQIMCTLGKDEKAINILCRPSAVGNTIMGGYVKVMVDGKDEDTFRIWGHIIDPNLR